MTRASAGWERVAGDAGGTVGGLATALVAGRSLVFAATSVGVYRSSDGGRTWLLSADRNTVPFTEVVAPSARFESDRTIFVGAGDGLYRSADGGESWQPVLVGSRMLSVSVANSPADGREGHVQVLLAGTETDGVLRSEDDGRTWTGANAGLLDLTALALALSPRFGSDRIGFAGMASGLYRTRNGARSWREVETGLSEPAVQCVAMSPTFADDRLVLAGTEADGLLRSDDAGGTWHRPASLTDQGVTAVAFSTRYPSKPTIAAATESGIALSDDGGRTWRRVAGSPPGVVLSLIFVATGAGEALLAGLHRHGIARSEDDGASWDVANAGLAARLLTGLVLSPAFGQDRTLFVTGPQDGVRVSTDGGRTWAERNAGLGESSVLSLAVSPDYAADRTLYVATADGIHLSHDGAATWHVPPSASSPAWTLATTAASVEDARPRVVAALSGGKLLASEDAGETWRAYGPGFDGADIISLVLSPNYARDRTLFVATSQTGSAESGEIVLWRSVDGGGRWDRWLVDREARSGAGRGQHLMALAASPSYLSDALVFVGLGARVLKPLRHAQEVRAGHRRPVWRAADLGEGAVAVTAVAPSPGYAQDQTVFAAANAGVFVSRDGGDTYQPWSEGLVPPSMVALAISPSYRSDRLLYALGLGGTIWRRHDQD